MAASSRGGTVCDSGRIAAWASSACRTGHTMRSSEVNPCEERLLRRF